MCGLGVRLVNQDLVGPGVLLLKRTCLSDLSKPRTFYSEVSWTPNVLPIQLRVQCLRSSQKVNRRSCCSFLTLHLASKSRTFDMNVLPITAACCGHFRNLPVHTPKATLAQVISRTCCAKDFLRILDSSASRLGRKDKRSSMKVLDLGASENCGTLFWGSYKKDPV